MDSKSLIQSVNLLSRKRLSKFNQCDIQSAIKFHSYNIELSETFYPFICYFEIILRNKMDMVFSKYFGDDWTINGNLKLTDKHSKNIEEAKHQLSKDNKAIEHDFIISELNFGFWTGFFLSDYHSLIWNRYPTMLAEIFNKTKMKTLKFNEKKSTLNKIRDYRNKVFHHGSIINSSNSVHPQRMYQLIIATFKDLDAECIIDEIKKIDRFNIVYQKGIDEGIIEIMVKK